MKNRFNTYDIICMITELQRLIGMRVNQVYDIDNRTYVIRLQRSEEKSILLLESGNRFHTTQFEWPKNMAPSGFTMKLRKHLKNKRLERLTQLGVDRIVDLQFGTGEAAYHVILELYDRGNIVLTDCEWTILNVLRPHVEGDKIRFAVKEKYPLDRAKTNYAAPSEEALKEILGKARPGDNLKKILNPNLEFGAAIIDHVLLENGLTGNMKVTSDPDKGFFVERDLDKLVTALKQAEGMLDRAKTEVSKGYIIQKKEERPDPSGGSSSLLVNVEFHPLVFAQHRAAPSAHYDTFDVAVDEFFSGLEGQKIDLKTVQVEREAMKKLQNVRKDHEKRVTELQQAQATDRVAAELIARNEPLVEQARRAVQTAIANQMSWDDIKLLVKTAQDNQDPVASHIAGLKLNSNHVTLQLSDPYAPAGDADRLPPMLVDIDLSLTAFANARRYYDQKRNAAKKQQKTLESADKALKSAERKTKQTLKEANTISTITKARKTYWFEKFFWFISSDNYLVIAGRDQQQNELLVKRHLRAGDVYAHAEVAGAASVLVKNPTGAPVPPRTLAEAGQAAVAYSVAWEAKVMTRAWWVHAHQVSKSAPTGEYLTTGSFMIRGRKNYLLPDHMHFGFTFMFRLEDSCIDRHRGERRAIPADDASDVTSVQEDEQEIVVSDDDDEPSDKEDTKSSAENKLDTISEETSKIDIRESKVEPEPNKEAEDAEKEDNVKEQDETERDNENKEGDGNEEDNKEAATDSDDDSSSESNFPNTHIKVDHGTGQVITQSKTRTISEVSHDSEETTMSFPSLPNKGGKKPQKGQSREQSKEQSKAQKTEERREGQLKRGQRAKMKRIRDKYGDQDEEDREIMMRILQSSNVEKESKKAQKKAAAAKASRGKAARAQRVPQPAPLLLEASDDDVEPDPEVEGAGNDAEAELLAQLTGAPRDDDELLFAVPVVAPYSALHNYKYKVKLTPGTSKRGKAAKTALQVFVRTRGATPRERDLLRAVRDEDVARNFPGRVRLSAPQLHKHKK